MTFIDKLVNKIKYRIDQLITDPEAEAAAARAKRAEHLTQMKAAATASDLSGAAITPSASPAPPTNGQYIMEIFIKTITIIITVFLALVGGSMAANTAIHRAPIIRILYFIYGIGAGLLGLLFFANPITFIPSLLLLAGLKYYDYLPHWYAFLPITQIPASTTLGQLLKKPFYWDPADPDNRANYLEKLKIFKGALESGLAPAAK